MDYWPGFVDALATLLLLFIFLLSVFMLVQFLLARDLSTRDGAIIELEEQIAELSQFLALEKNTSNILKDQLFALTDELEKKTQEHTDTLFNLKEKNIDSQEQSELTQKLQGKLEQSKSLHLTALKQISLLNQQISALRRQISVLQVALETAEKKDRESRVEIANLGKRLNTALARRVQLLSQYRSDFFGRLREILGEDKNILIQGDRFVFQSEVFFESGSGDISQSATGQLQSIANLILSLEKKIPSDIQWILRIDGHTDTRPISNNVFRSNWELSAQRAISVARALIEQGVSPKRLLAAGFGEYQPLIDENTPAAHSQNRRIEFKLTER